jgi:hypothetical protein
LIEKALPATRLPVAPRVVGLPGSAMAVWLVTPRRV